MGLQGTERAGPRSGRFDVRYGRRHWKLCGAERNPALRQQGGVLPQERGVAPRDAERRILGLDYDAGDHGAVRALDPPVILFLKLVAALCLIPGTFRCSAGRR